MIKELKYLFYIFVIFGFFYFTGSYYFSDKNKKFSYRSISLFDTKTLDYANNLISLIIRSYKDLNFSLGNHSGILSKQAELKSFSLASTRLQKDLP